MPGKGDWLPLTEVLVPYILLGDPGPDTRGPNTPGNEKLEEDVGGMLEPMLRAEENWLVSDDRESLL